MKKPKKTKRDLKIKELQEWSFLMYNSNDAKKAKHNILKEFNTGKGEVKIF